MGITGFTVEAAKREDLEALSGLLDTLFSIEQDFSPNTEKQIKGLALLLDHPERAMILVAREESGRVVGMVTAQLVFSTAEGAPSVWIEDMVVEAGCRKLGLGKLLLQSMLDWAAGEGAMRAQLLVDLDNEPALGFYDHLGWHSTRLGARRLYLGNAELT